MPGKKSAGEEKRRKASEKVIKAFGVAWLGALVLILAVFLVIHYYLSKIDYQRDGDAAGMESAGTEDYSDEKILPVVEPEEEADAEEDSDAAKIAGLEEQLRRQMEDMEEILSDEEVFNILLIGSDSRQKDGGGRSDANILLSINQKTKEITMTSIMRDCYVAIPGHGNNRINAAYAYGGAALLLKTIETSFGISVDKYVAVDFYSFIDIVDVLGGVDIEVSDDEVKVMNWYIKGLNQLKEEPEERGQLDGGGLLHLNGIQTLAYARVRYVGNADFERTQRQRIVLFKLFEKAKEMNLLELNDLLNVLLPEVKTNMSEGEIFSLLLRAPEYLQYELKSLRIPVDGSYESLRIRGMAVLGVDLEKNRKILKEEVYTD